MKKVARAGVVLGVSIALHVCAVPPSTAQPWGPRPVTAASGRVVFGGDVSATVGSSDPGWFTYTDYETSALRRVRAGIAVRARLAQAWSVVFEARGETGRGIVPYAWYVRYRPWSSGALTVQGGRIPPVFGAYARRSYPQDNPLIGDPVLYQYLTTLRPDAVPATTDDLLAMRGRGWLVRYPVGQAEWRNGVPVVAASRWDTGVEALVARGPFEGALAVTSGSLSYPRAAKTNGTPHVAARVNWAPAAGVLLGLSGSTSVFLDQALSSGLPPASRARSHRQRAIGIDGEFSRGYWLVRGELVSSTWSLPELGVPALAEPVGARGGYIEVRYRLRPRVYVAARGDALAFEVVRGSQGLRTWDAGVGRLEAGLGVTLSRGVLLKGSGLFNRRDGGLVRRDVLWAAQLLWWF